MAMKLTCFQETDFVLTKMTAALGRYGFLIWSRNSMMAGTIRRTAPRTNIARGSKILIAIVLRLAESRNL